jgi:hypothetical protein
METVSGALLTDSPYKGMPYVSIFAIIEVEKRLEVIF